MFRNVAFSYDDNKVLRGVSFTAKEGEVTALVGPSGSGKSTCARLAARLWDVTEGSIEVGGIDIKTVDPEVLLTDYSMVFQDVVLLDEATASLDVENETKVQGALSRLLENKTVLVIAHRMRTVEDADKIVVLDNGRVLSGDAMVNQATMPASIHTDCGL